MAGAAVACLSSAPRSVGIGARVAPIRILMAESNQVISQALQRLLQPAVELDIVAVAADGREALQLAARYQPAVALLNIALLPVQGRSVIANLKERFPAMHIVALAIYPMLRDETLAAGACQFVLLDAPLAELIAAIQAAAAGECQFADVSMYEGS